MNFLSVLYAKAGITVDGVTTLNNTATGQTPATNDNSTKLATTGYVKNQNYYPYPTGTTSQYVRGDGSLATFTQTGGGGSSVSYYLNGSVSQGTIGGNTYYEMSKTAIIGTGVDFSINANGYVAQFVTDAGDPALLSIPGGNWNFEMFFSASSGGGTPSFYVELYKYDGTTLTLIASGSTNPESITNGTVTDLYLTSLAVPTTTLTLTDRLAIRVYVLHSGRTITLHTQDSHLCQVITSFTTGLTALNGLTAQVQNFAVGAGGSDFNISSVVDTHTFNLPTASATKRGALSSIDWSAFDAKVDFGDLSATAPLNYNGSGLFTIAQSSASTNGYLSSTDWTTFNSKVGGSGTIGYLPKFTGTGTLGNSALVEAASYIQSSKRIEADDAGYSLVAFSSAGNRQVNIGVYGGEPTIQGTLLNGTARQLALNPQGGNVGIAISNPTYPLDVNGDIFGRGNIRIGGSNIFYFETFNGGWYMQDTTWIRSYASKSLWMDSGKLGADGGLTIGYGGASPSTGGAIIAGNVGIGTTSPSRLLNISGSGTDGTQLQINGTGDSAGIKFIPQTGDNWEIQANTSSQFFIYNRTDSAYRFLIDTAGNVGIGTTTPNHLLTLNNTASGGTYFGLYQSYVDGNDWRNWVIGTNDQAFGDFVIKQSNATGGNPNSAGTIRLYIAKSGAASFSSSVTAQGANIGINALGTDRMFQISGNTFTTGATQFAAVINPTMGAVTDLFGIYAGLSCTSATNYYALYLEIATGTITNRWGIYQVGGSDKNYFAGNVLIGTTTDAGGYKLNVNGTANFSSSVTISTANNINPADNVNTVVVGNVGDTGWRAKGIGGSAAANHNWTIAHNALKLYFGISNGVAPDLASWLVVSPSGAVEFNSLAGSGSRMVVADASGALSTQAIPAGSITGSGTTNYITKWTGSTALGNSVIYDNGTYVGIGTTSPSALFEVVTSAFPVAKIVRTSTLTNQVKSSFASKHLTTADMVDGFGSDFSFMIQDSSGVENEIANFGAMRDGADNSGALGFWTRVAGTKYERLHIASTGEATFSSSVTAAGNYLIANASATKKGYTFSSPASNWGAQTSGIYFNPIDAVDATPTFTINLWNGTSGTAGYGTFTDVLSINGAGGHATFSSSVTAGALGIGSTANATNPVTGSIVSAGGLGLGGDIFLHQAAASGQNYSYIKTVTTTANTNTLVLGTTYGYNTNVDAVSFYNGTATFAGNLTGTTSLFSNSVATTSHGTSGKWIASQTANGNFIPYSFESDYGNHSWGIIARFRINQAGFDRPSIQFSNASTDNRWNVGYCFNDDQFRITQNMGYRNDNTTTDSWGTERFRIDTFGTLYANGNVILDAGNVGSYAVKLYGTISGNIDSDYGESFVTFDPVPSGTPPLASPNIRTINVGNNYNRRTQLAFDYASDTAFFRRRSDSTWYAWREFIHSGNIGSQSVSFATTAGALTSMNVSQFTNDSGYITSSGSISGNAATATNISNNGTVTLATATESNSIYITQPSYSTDQPVKLLNFAWYSEVWQMGNIRSGGATTAGFGIYLNGSEKFRFNRDGVAIFGSSATFGSTITATNGIFNNAAGGSIVLKYGGTDDWVVGENAGAATRDFNIYNFNRTSIELSISRATGTATFAGRVNSTAWTTTGRNYSNEWIEFPNNSGLYSPINGAHFLPNPNSYGSWKVQGTRNGWAGLEFGALSNGSICLMVYPSSNQTGFYNTTYGWQFLWDAGTLRLSKNTYGGGALYTVLDEGNYTSYLDGTYLALSGGTITGDLTVNNKVYVGTHGCYFQEVLVSGVYELQVVDSAGNITVLS